MKNVFSLSSFFGFDGADVRKENRFKKRKKKKLSEEDETKRSVI